MLSVSTKQQRIAKIAKQKKGEPITQLHHYIDERWLKSAFHGLREKSAPGIDAQSVEEYSQGLEKRLKRLLYQAKSGKYKAPPVRRVEIPKPGSQETRPIGIPTTEDKILQKAVQMVLEPVYELEFYEYSFGFRPGKSQHQALAYLWKRIMDNNIQWIIDLDIRKFFDTVEHETLRKLLNRRVCDGVITRLIGKWLNAGVMKEGRISYPEKGTPQGSIVSPLLSNIYLHETLDKWYKEEIQPQLQGKSFMIRYADDALMGFQTKEEAEHILEALKARLLEFGLELHPEKTRLVYFGKPGGKNNQSDQRRPGSFDFLGFTHYWGKSLNNIWVVKRKTAGKKFREKLKTMKQWCKKNRHLPLEEQYKKICQKIKGHYAYYGITGNAKSLSRYLNEVTRIWKKWLCRRSWRGVQLNWERFRDMINTSYPLPPIKIVHSIYRVANP